MTSAAVIILSASTLPLAQQIATVVDGEIHAPNGTGIGVAFESFTDHLAILFSAQVPVIGICAAGILVRAVAPLLHNKHDEPPVVAVSHDGSSVVPLLGGHHGGNELARRIADAIGGFAAVTTASDVVLGVDLETPPAGYVLATPHLVKSHVRALLDGERFQAKTAPFWLAEMAAEDGRLHVDVTVNTAGADRLTYFARRLVVGVGCERGCEPAEVLNLVRETLAQFDLAPDAIAHFATIDLKEDEPAINALGDVRYFSTPELNAMSSRVLRPSAVVFAEVGTPSVAEASALAAAGVGGELIVPKQKSKRATCAVALAADVITGPKGRSRGALHVIGLGPGDPSMRSPEATRHLSQSTDWVGYDLYLDLANDLHKKQTLHKFPLGAEEIRVRHAIKLAREGRKVSLICSGDAGIYAMASLVCEILDLEPARFEVSVTPGISAFQAAAARAGAIIGHDFCCISLSDLLTPWTIIEQRITAAAEGDFVVAFYNPRSMKRDTQLVAAIEILRPLRQASTPVILASNLGRPEERVRIVKLEDFNPADVDMLTVVLVGSSQSATFTRGDGRSYAYTPRGYAKKRAAE